MLVRPIKENSKIQTLATETIESIKKSSRFLDRVENDNLFYLECAVYSGDDAYIIKHFEHAIKNIRSRHPYDCDENVFVIKATNFLNEAKLILENIRIEYERASYNNRHDIPFSICLQVPELLSYIYFFIDIEELGRMNVVCKTIRDTITKEQIKEKIIDHYGYCRLFVKNCTGKTTSVYANPNKPVKELRERFCNKIDIDTDHMRLLKPKISGDLDDTKTLDYYGITNNSILHAAPTLSKRQGS